MESQCQLQPNDSTEACNATNLSQSMDTLTSWRMFRSGLQTILFFTSAVTNCFVLLVIYKHKQTLKGPNLFALNLVLAGTLTTFTVMPTIMVSAYTSGCLGSDVTCSVHGSLVTGLTSCRSMTILCITMDRYFALCYPLAYKSKATTKKIQLATVLIWIFSFAVALLPVLVKSKITKVSGIGFCFPKQQQFTNTFEKSYTVMLVLCVYILPSCILTYTNTLIFIKTRGATANKRMYSGVHIFKKQNYTTDSRKTLMDRHPFSLRQNGVPMTKREKSKLLEVSKSRVGVHKDNRKAAWMLFVCIMSFIFCNGPFSILLTIHSLPGRYRIPSWIEFSAVTFLFLNPIINPCIYVFRNVCVKNLIITSIPNNATSEERKELKRYHKKIQQSESTKLSKTGAERCQNDYCSSDQPSKIPRHETTIVFHTETKGVITIL